VIASALRMKWHTYILECNNGSLYTGVTTDLDRRFKEHCAKTAHYTSYNPPKKIVYQELFPSRSEALKREAQIKKLTRKKKLALIAGDVGRFMKQSWVVQAVLLFGVLWAINGYGGEAFMSKNIVVLETNQGVVEVELMPEAAPKACENFLKLAEKGYYDGLIFHRVIRGFMIQGGDPTGTGTGGESIWGKPFQDEASPKVQFDSVGLLAMANSGPNTNGSQFFITTAKTPWLNGRHTIFGKVVAGYEGIQKIEGTATNGEDRPISPQKILKAYLKK
jgi:peptidylprolyl isomerase